MSPAPRRLLRHTAWLFAGLILLAAFLTAPAFRRPDYWLTLGQQNFAPAALALALLPVMLTGGIDLSVGSVAVLASVVIGLLVRDGHWPPAAALAAGVLTGLLAGLVNGGLVALGVLPLVATLATGVLFRGLAYTLSGDSPVTRFPPGTGAFWRQAPAGVPVPILALGTLALLTYLVVHHTWAGRMLYALGDNEEAARFAGLPVRGLKVALYAWCGLVAGLCGAALVMNYGAAKPDAEKALELSAIACVVLGGVRVTGGAGRVVDVLVGIVTVVALLAWLNSMAPTWRETVTGALLILVAGCNEAAARWLAGRAALERGKGTT
jgi:ribose/xylose/arabinose/galactoside ABC-type transport system permease subunit